jgi:hypothetical protein
MTVDPNISFLMEFFGENCMKYLFQQKKNLKLKEKLEKKLNEKLKKLFNFILVFYEHEIFSSH